MGAQEPYCSRLHPAKARNRARRGAYCLMTMLCSPSIGRRLRRLIPAALLGLAGCGRAEQIERFLGASTPYERYAASLRGAGLDATALGRAWLGAGEGALRAARWVVGKPPRRYTLADALRG